MKENVKKAISYKLKRYLK